MKIVVSLIVAVLVLVIPNRVIGEEKREARPRFKGVEMYSWKDGEGNWMFALVDGTNAQKTEKQVKEDRNAVKGIDALKKSLALLAQGEQVFWGSHRCPGFELPNEATQNAIVQAANAAKIKLSIDK